MTKHRDLVIRADDLLEGIARDTDENAADVLDFRHVDHLRPEGFWLVQWPDHVSNPRFNSDATYSPLSDEDAGWFVRGGAEVFDEIDGTVSSGYRALEAAIALRDQK